MPRDKATLSAVLALMASSCASAPQYGNTLSLRKCGSDQSEWTLAPAPLNADEYRSLASHHSVRNSDSISDREWGHYDDETWLASASGEIILCLTDGPPTEAWSSTWWRFKSTVEQIEMVDKGATITVG